MNLKRVASALIAILISASVVWSLGSVTYGATFSDTKGHWAEKKVDLASEMKLVQGFSDGTFKPNKPIKRSEFITIVVRINNPEIQSSKGYWAQAFIDKAIELNLMTEAQFGGSGREVYDKNITRIEMVGILWAFIKQNGLPTDKEPPVLNDVAALNMTQKEQLDLVLKAGLMSGYGNGKFGPNNTSTRAEAATICVNISESLKAMKNAGEGNTTNPQLYGTDTGYKIGDVFDPKKSNKAFKVNNYLTYHLLSPIENGEFQLVAVDASGKVVLSTRSELPGNGTVVRQRNYDSHTIGSQKFYEYKDPGYAGSGEKPRTLFLFEISPSVESHYNAKPANSEEMQAFEELCDLLVNVFRLQIGEKTTASNPLSLKAARDFSKLMVDRNFFDHNGPDGNTFSNRVKNSGISYWEIAENIAFGYNTPVDLIAGWVNSEGHRHNMADPDMDHANIGIHIGPNGVVATQWLFKKK